MPSSIKDKTILSREILEECDCVEKLIEAETRWLAAHHGLPNCMNISNTSTGAPIGDANPMRNLAVVEKISGDNHYLKKYPEKREIFREIQVSLVKEGSHNFLGDSNPNKDGSVSKKTAAMGRNIWQTNNPSIWRSEQGIHHWQHGGSPNAGGKLNKKLIEEGRHNFLGPEHNKRMVAEGKNPWVGAKANLDRLAAGTHPSQQIKTCEHCGKSISVGMYARWHGDNCKQRK